GVLSKYNFTSSNSNVSVSASGNTLTITSQKAVTEDVLLTATKRSPAVSGTLVAYGDASLQDVVVGVESASDITVYLSVKIPYGHVQIVKTSEDGIVEGLRFQITGNGIDKTVVMGKNGKIKVENLNPGTYTVTELTEERYEPQKSQKVTVSGGQTAKVEFSNILKRGDLKVIKGSEDNLVEGVRFHLYGTALSGAVVDEYAVTDKNGVAVFSNILISGSTPYTLEEVDTAVRYVIPEKQSVTIKWKEVTSATVTNILKKFRVNVTKTDRETGEPQGDATLAGAVYGIYDGDTLIDTYTTDSEGKFTTKYYEDGNVVATGVTDKNGLATFTLRYGKYTYQEYDAPEGYLIDEREFPFEIKEDGQVVKASMTNEKKPVEIITTPKTGDESNVGLWIALSALSVAGIGVFGVLAAMSRKRKGQED
ncbi:MAG: SpaA isopeptide-forming pilin-related protein, partial [Lachnospiraceae bacterium]|nr:SpaA isopeptide-forming pilin-related protein [Lachnospiraceae bacterium]